MTLERPMFPPRDPTRRHLLTVAAGGAVAGLIPTAVLAAVAAIDPVLGLIEAHRKAHLAHMAALELQNRFERRYGIGGAGWVSEKPCHDESDEKRRAAETGEDVQAIPFLKRFTVFNIDQCEDLPDKIATTTPPPPPGLIEPTVEALIKATGIAFRIGGERAFYAPAEDYVQVPPPQAYFEPINWHRTALHELGHATGHPSRLNRDQSGSHSTKKYAFEELVAELSSAFSCASLGIVPTVRHADYIGAWLDVLREDNRAVVRAASQASKAADYLLGFVSDPVANAPVDPEVGNDEAA